MAKIMSNFYTDDNGQVQVQGGADIDSTLDEAKTMAQTRVELGRHNGGEIIVFVFSDVTVKVGPDSDLALIRRDFNRAVYGYIPMTVGPNPEAVLSKEELHREAEIEIDKVRYAASAAIYRAKNARDWDRAAVNSSIIRPYFGEEIEEAVEE